MWRAAAGLAGRHIGRGAIGRRWRRIAGNNGRAVISRAERKAGNDELRSGMVGEIFTRTQTRGLATPSLRLKRGRRPIKADRIGKDQRKPGIAKSNWPTL